MIEFELMHLSRRMFSGSSNFILISTTRVVLGVGLQPKIRRTLYLPVIHLRQKKSKRGAKL